MPWIHCISSSWYLPEDHRDILFDKCLQEEKRIKLEFLFVFDKISLLKKENSRKGLVTKYGQQNKKNEESETTTYTVMNLLDDNLS